ncbi:Multiple inositol polyphosphate phosphatase 1 [Amphibalanus amphitrite]|uniref:Multiple inositol polyphosphate phosphatase 1 n=1 Tax=Amphibalanus amphitrite TaxID=1232801 RepID=A0A6A4VD70_AMPAM|nr:Multiple inositol polyphosphate phosphatase 1 [Amphibalanus amphitrite]
MGLLGVLIAGLLYHTCVIAQDDNQACYATVGEPYTHFGTKTPYSVVLNKDDSEVKFPGCRPAQFWLTARHGTRYPGEDDIELMARRLPELQQTALKNAAEGRGELCEQDLTNIRSWSLAFDVSVENNLTPSGEQELFDMAKRFQRRFPTLLGPPYSPEKHKFQSTVKQRARESGRFFAKGLFGDQPVEFPKSEKNHPLLQFYKTCNRWRELIDDSEASRHERYTFQNSTHMLGTIDHVSRRLGFTSNMSYADVRLIYDICRYDKTLHPDRVSAWCAAFSEQDLKVMEFDMDLEYYWVDSYGYELNYRQACPQVKDFITKFNAVRSSPERQPLANMYFSHLGGVLKFITLLGVFNDTRPLTSADFGTSHAFRSSLASAFATNVALVLFECSDGYRVATYVQEHPTELPGCGSLLCPLDELAQRYRSAVESCDLEGMCAAAGWLAKAWNTALWALPALAALV